MDIYQQVPDEYKSIAIQYSHKGEYLQISNPVIWQDKKYFEIVYNRKVLGFFKNGIAGRLIIDEQGLAVKNRDILDTLARLFYFYSLLFNKQAADFKKTIKTDIQAANEENRYKEASVILEHLSGQGVAGAGRVKSIIDRYSSMKKEENNVTKMVVDKINKYESSDILFSQQLFEEVYPLFTKLLVMNFERVKLINTASDYYDSVKEEIIKRKKTLKNRINKNLQDTMTKPENIITFFINILKYYNEVINYSTDRYIKYLSNKDDEEIKKYLSYLRNN